MEKENKISEITTILMISTAFFFDVFQGIIGWIPVVGNIFAGFVSLFVFMTFWLWFHMYGIQMMTLKRFGALGFGWVVETIPYANLLPGWTIVVIFLIGTTKVKNIASKNPLLSKGINVVEKKLKN